MYYALTQQATRLYPRPSNCELGGLQQKSSIDDRFKWLIVDEDNKIVFGTVSTLAQESCHISRLRAEQKSAP